MNSGPRHLLLRVERRIPNGHSKWADVRVHKDGIAWYEAAPIMGENETSPRWGVRALVDGMGWVAIDVPIEQLDRYCLEAELKK